MNLYFNHLKEMKIARILKIKAFIISMFYLTASPIFAQDGVARICDLQEVIVNGFNFIIAVFPFLGLGVLITGTFFWMTSQGDPQKLQRARDTLTYGVLGFVLGLSAVLIVGTIEVFLLDVENFRWIDEEGNFQFVQVGICEVEGEDVIENKTAPPAAERS